MSRASRLMDAREIDRALTRMAHELLELSGGGEQIALVGIHSRGVPLAQRLAKKMAEAGADPPPIGALDIGLYRDDLGRGPGHPVLRRTELLFSLEGRPVVLVDDVLFTGRTIRAALDALVDLGRPARILLAALVDRGGRELPIQPDLVGRRVEARADETVAVRLSEVDRGRDRVELVAIDPDRDASGSVEPRTRAPRRSAAVKKGNRRTRGSAARRRSPRR